MSSYSRTEDVIPLEVGCGAARFAVGRVTSMALMVSRFSSDASRGGCTRLSEKMAIHVARDVQSADGIEVAAEAAGPVFERPRWPNKAPEPTPTAVMPRAYARVTPAVGVAHL